VRGQLLQAALLLACLLVSALLDAPAARAMTAVPFGEVIATSSGKCLQVQGASTTAGAAIVQSECIGSASELWELLPAPTVGDYQLSVGVSGQCLAILHSGAVALAQQPCAIDPYQNWSVLPQTGGGYILQSQQTGNCVGVQGASQSDAVALVQSACNGSTSQLIQFEQPAFVASAPVNIVSQSSGQCVGVTNGASANFTYTVQYPCGTVANSTWKFHPISAGVVEVINSGNGLCLGVYSQSTSAGGALDEYTCVNHTNQYFALRASGNAWELVAQNSGLCVTLSTGSPAAIVQQPCAGTIAQLWSFHAPGLPAIWSAPVAEKSVAVAAANLPNGKILTWAADSTIAFGTTGTGQTYTELLDPVAGTDSQAFVTNTGHNMFCPGIANLPDGTIFVNGGETNPNTSIYNWQTNSWSTSNKMNVGRAYEGTVLNADNTVFTIGGSWSTPTQGNTPGELWNASTGWKLLSNMPSNPAWTADAAGAYRADNHMWLHVLSGGRLLQAGPSATMHWINVYGDNGLGLMTSAGTRGSDPDSMNGNASAYDVDKLLKVGGAPSYQYNNATANALLIDGSSAAGNPVATALAPMAYARAFGNSVVLPNGQVVVTGGQTYPVPFTDTNAILVPELWDPVTQVFSTMAPMATPRTYHGVALLLPDGRVWVSGGGLCGSCSSSGANHLTYEILTPPYLLTASGAAATRPVISAVSATTLAPGATLTITTQTPVKSFALIRLSSVTHTVNNDQRRIPLVTTTPDGATYTATLSSDPGVLVAGYYMLFALSPTGVPSMSVTLLIT
jgi:galactose oxidase